MRRTGPLVALMVVVGTLAFPVAGVGAQETETPTDELNAPADENATVSPGERLSGVVGVQEAEVEAEIETRGLELALTRADDNASTAVTIAQTLTENEARLAELKERRTELDAQRENGTISEGEYRARMATLATEVETVEEQLNQTTEAVADLPEGTLEENGVNTTAIRTLEQTASELHGQEVAEIAQSIAGDERGDINPEDRDRDRDRSEAEVNDREDDDAERDNRTEKRDSDRQDEHDRADGEQPANDGSTETPDDGDVESEQTADEDDDTDRANNSDDANRP